MTKNTFIKQERLTGKTTIDRLFSSGKSFFCYPFRMAYVIVGEAEDQSIPCSVLINVPKRLHKTAVARNLLKRRIKEAYRLNKHAFYTQLGEHKIQLAVLYSAKEVNDSETISKKLLVAEKLLLNKLNADVSKIEKS